MRSGFLIEHNSPNAAGSPAQQSALASVMRVRSGACLSENRDSTALRDALEALERSDSVALAGGLFRELSSEVRAGGRLEPRIARFRSLLSCL